MTKVMIELELDGDAYKAKYGPGTEWWDKYMTTARRDEATGDYIYEVKPAAEFRPMEGAVLNEAIIDVLCEGFYDWSSEGWFKLTIDGKAVRKCCKSLDGEAHKDYCEAKGTA